MLATAAAFPALAQDKPKLRFSAVFSEQDIRAEMMKMFADAIKDDFAFEGYYGGNLFKQGTELVALQRGNLEMGNIAPQDISKQIPAWSIVTAGYLFRDAAHLKTFFASDVGAELKKMTEDQLGVQVLGPTYFGVRQVGLKPDKEIKTPADMAGIKLRMPGGDAWQFLGTALGANPTPMAYAEVYTGLQTGAIDGQDNPLPNVENMKFYEVMSQIVLTSHLVGFDLLTVSKKVWDEMGAEKQAKFQAAADAAIDFSTREAPRAREGAGRAVQGQGAEDLRARRRRLPQACAGAVPGVRPRQGLAGRHGRQDQRALGRRRGGHRVAPQACRIPDMAVTGGEACVNPALRDLGRWLYRRAENVLAAMLAAMFAAFILQIVFRYLLNLPIGWTNEISVILWIWLVLWGAAFVVREEEEIRFDLFYASARPSGAPRHVPDLRRRR